MCGHLRGCQRLLLLGAAAGLEEPRVDDHLSKAALVDDPTAHLLPGATSCKSGLVTASKAEQVQQTEAVRKEGQWSTSSSRIGPGRSRWRGWSVSAWTRGPNRRRTGCCNWATGQETRWRWCCGHRSLLGNQTQTHRITDVTVTQRVAAQSYKEIETIYTVLSAELRKHYSQHVRTKYYHHVRRLKKDFHKKFLHLGL